MFHSSFGDRADCLQRFLDKIVSRETDQSMMIDWPLIEFSLLNLKSSETRQGSRVSLKEVGVSTVHLGKTLRYLGVVLVREPFPFRGVDIRHTRSVDGRLAVQLTAMGRMIHQNL